ncbi:MULTISPECIES: pseudouridine synthase [Neisseria]|uniref:Pseudouridine synthase n=1 Tax=Neisseria dumasiana TaxID=1931275 RepID=A0ABX3WPA1_9NEIS|nr:MULTISPECIES: pseudouridine synthase [Neisseria]KPN74653.1 pseudouridine synthase [Neisseria sp. 74A18]OSI37087.1 pseudouridine synthase [Neisseria dumasiana]UOO83629.1 pseudouridine synthase [Neisseria dumasiana]
MNDLIVFNKPYGVICQFSAHEKHPSLKDYINAPGFYPAGRLDTDSEGLLLLTNNGRLQAQIAEPKHGKQKTYWAQVEGSPDEAKLNLLRNGVDLGDFVTLPAQVRVLDAGETDRLWPRIPPIRERKTVPDFWLEITISEGKNRQVRRMTAKAGYPCLRLVRIAVGRLNIFDLGLETGQWRFSSTKP